MRILFLSHRFTDVEIGGLAEFLQFLPKNLRERGIESFIYTQTEKSSDSAIISRVLKNGVTHYSGPFVKPALFAKQSDVAVLVNLCRTLKIDAIHAQGLYRSGYLAYHVWRKTNIPYVITSHSDVLVANSPRMQKRSVKSRCKTILKYAAAVTHLTPAMQAASHRFLDTSNKDSIIHNGIDLTAWQSIATQNATPYLIAIGRLVSEKGFSILIDAIAKLHHANNPLSLVIAGTGPDELTLKAQARALSLNVVTDITDPCNIPTKSIIFTGYIRENIKKTFMINSRGVLFATQPSQWQEPFGIVLLEGLAAKKPVIASELFATNYLSQQGLPLTLIKADDVAAWTDAMFALSSNKQAVNFSEKISYALSSFDWSIVAKDYYHVYADMISQHKIKIPAKPLSIAINRESLIHS